MDNDGAPMAGAVSRCWPDARRCWPIGLPDTGLGGQDAATQAPTAYRGHPYVGSRNLVWIIAQLHSPCRIRAWRTYFAWLCEVVGWKSGDKRYDKPCQGKFTKSSTSSYATTALFGGIPLFLLIGFYPKPDGLFDRHFLSPSFSSVHCGLFLVETATSTCIGTVDAMSEGNGKKFTSFWLPPQRFVFSS